MGVPPPLQQRTASVVARPTPEAPLTLETVAPQPAAEPAAAVPAAAAAVPFPPPPASHALALPRTGSFEYRTSPYNPAALRGALLLPAAAATAAPAAASPATAHEITPAGPSQQPNLQQAAHEHQQQATWAGVQSASAQPSQPAAHSSATAAQLSLAHAGPGLGPVAVGRPNFAGPLPPQHQPQARPQAQAAAHTVRKSPSRSTLQPSEAFLQVGGWVGWRPHPYPWP